MLHTITLLFLLLFTGQDLASQPAVKNNFEQGQEQWTRSACYRGLAYRLSFEKDPNDINSRIWSIEIINKYDEIAYFNYDLFARKDENNTTRNRTRLMSKQQIRASKKIKLPVGSIPLVVIDKLRLIEDDNSPYVRCGY